MDQIKIGQFIAKMRKEQSLTQQQLADQLHVSNKTISKWECGHGLPEITLMLPLCDILNININELLSGERIKSEEYQKKAEKNILNLIKEKEENKKKIIISFIIALITIIAAISFIWIALQYIQSIPIKIMLLLFSLFITIIGLSASCILDREAGVYECRHCGHAFTPDLKSYLFGAHTLTKRYLKCPNCGKSSYCRHRLHQ